MTRRITLAVALITGIFGASTARSESFVSQHAGNSTVVRVEEDWSTVISEPDSAVTAPQITTTFSPSGGLTGLYAIFNLNHQALESFAPGGMQLQIWNGDSSVSHYRINPEEVLEEDGEEITWTQVMDVGGNGVLFRIEDGDSSTWGEFGGERFLTERVSSSLNSLNGYDPAVSVANSGVTFARNRVESLVLLRVRLYKSTGDVVTVELNSSALHDE